MRSPDESWGDRSRPRRWIGARSPASCAFAARRSHGRSRPHHDLDLSDAFVAALAWSRRQRHSVTTDSAYRHHHPRPYQGWLAGPTVNSLMVVASGWSIAIATTLAIRSGEIWYRSYVSRICSAVSSWLIMPSSSVLIAAGQIVAVRMFV